MAYILLRYGEIHLKGHNQRFFVDRLVRNVRESIADLGDAQVRHAFGRVLVDSPAEEAALISRLRKVFGIVSLSPVRVVAPAFPDIASTAVDMVGAALQTRPDAGTFKVDTRRADKRFPLTS
ncbi:MAG TPA: THUMP domain-containing protein, partial [bacterium]|nr:THUMP domain-containing protein [bacterium]